MQVRQLLPAVAFAAASALAPALLVAQGGAARTPAEHVAAGDRDHAARNASGALAHYEAALAANPAYYDALWRASREAVDLGEFHEDARQRTALYAKGADYARRAVEANAADAEGHFAKARAVGREALTRGSRERVRFAGEVRREALEALRLDPTHAGALHVLGVWHAEVMRLSGMERFFAKNLLGGKTFGEANWNDAARNLERAVAEEPGRITHRLDLARIYLDVGSEAKAREQLERIAALPVVEYNDPHYKRQAAELLAKQGG